MLKEDESFDPCLRYSVNDHGRCDVGSFNKSNIEVCETFIYDTSVVEESLTTKFNLVCDLEYQQTLLGTVVMVGILFGSLIGGRLSDKFGRKNTLMLSVLIIVPTIMFAGCSANFWTYAAIKFINTMMLPCIWFSSHVLITEIFGKDYRQNAVVIRNLMGPISMMITIGVFYLTRHYVYFHLWIGALCALTIPALIIVPESPGWLIVKGKWKSAERIFLRIARWNRKVLSAEDKQKISFILKKLNSNLDAEKEKTLGVFDLMSPDHLIKTSIMTLNWIIVCVRAYTLAFNMTRLSGNVFVNSILVSVLGGIPGNMLTWFMLTYFSRRSSLFTFQFMSGLFCVVVAFLPKNYELAVISFYILASCSSKAALSMVYLITGELYPTNLRTQAIGTCSTISIIFGISAAFMHKLSCIWRPLPMLVLGVPSIMISFVAYFLPETKKTKLPLTEETQTNCTFK
jgi:MFS family permease